MGISFSEDSQSAPLILSEEHKLFDWVGTAYIGTPSIITTSIQYSDEKTVAVGGGTSQVFGAVIDTPFSRSLVSMDLFLSFRVKSDGNVQNKWYQWRARNKSGATWVNLHGTISELLTTSYVGTIMAGIIPAQANLDMLPLEIGLFAVSGGSQTFVSQVDNSSYVITKYRP